VRIATLHIGVTQFFFKGPVIARRLLQEEGMKKKKKKVQRFILKIPVYLQRRQILWRSISSHTHKNAQTSERQKAKKKRKNKKKKKKKRKQTGTIDFYQALIKPSLMHPAHSPLQCSKMLEIVVND
jgi:hypothetical protein